MSGSGMALGWPPFIHPAEFERRHVIRVQCRHPSLECIGKHLLALIPTPLRLHELLSCLQLRQEPLCSMAYGAPHQAPQLCSVAAAAVARVGSLADCTLVAEDDSSYRVSKAVVAVHSSVLGWARWTCSFVWAAPATICCM